MPSEAENLEKERLRYERLRLQALKAQAQSRSRLQFHTLPVPKPREQGEPTPPPSAPSDDLTKTIQLQPGDKIPADVIFLNPDPNQPKFYKDKQGKKRLSGRVVGTLRPGDITPIPLNPTIVTPHGKRVALQTGAATLAELAIPIPGSGILAKGTQFLRPVVGEMAGSLASEEFDPSESAGKRMLQEGALGMVGEGVGRLGLATVRRMLGKSPTALPGIDEAQALLREEGASLTPAQATRAFSTDILENVAEASFLGGGGVRKQKIGAVEAGTRIINRFVDALKSKASQEEIGTLLQDSIERGVDGFRETARAMYGKIDDIAPDGVDITRFQEDALSAFTDSQRGLKSSPIEALAEEIIDRPNVIPFADAIAMRTDLMSFNPGATDLVKGKAKRAAAILAQSLDRAMEAAAKNQNPAALAAWREANAFWKGGVGKFNSKFIKSLVKKDPETVFEAVIKPRRPGTIRNIRNMVNSDSEWRAVQGQFLDNWLKKAAGTGEEVSGDALMRGLNGFGDDAINELFPSGELAKLKVFARTIQLGQTKTEASHFRLAVQFGQSGVILGFLTRRSVNVLDGVTLLMGPAALAKLYTSPIGYKLLVEGFKAPPGSKEGFMAATRFLAFARENQIIEESNKNYRELSEFLNMNQAIGSP